jgi:hypothetical protein
MTDDEPDDGGRREALDRSRRVGPLRYRLQAVGRLLVVVAIWAVLGAVVGTVTGLYHGANGGRRYGDEVAATADVASCRRTGPIASDALGYWWDCDVTIRTTEGRVVRMTVDRSMVTPDDVGRPVEFEETCDKVGENCRYGIPTAYGWYVLVGTLSMLHIGINLCLAVFAFLFLIDAIFGAGRAHDIVARFRDRNQSSS